MAQAKEHLNADQIDWFLEPEARDLIESSRTELFEQASQHLAICVECQRLVAMHKGWAGVLDRIRDELPAEATPGCATDARILELAAGVIRGPEAEKLLSHIVECAHCAPLFRRMSDAFAENTSSGDEQLLISLQSANLEWQLRLVKNLLGASAYEAQVSKAETSERRGDIRGTVLSAEERGLDAFFVLRWWRNLSLRSRIVSSTALATGLCVAVWLGIYLHDRTNVDQMLADAYSDKRLMEPRIAGARYAPVSAERGALDEPQALLDAKALIGRQLKASPNDPKWLHAKGQADLLELQYDAAITVLQQALDVEPNSSPIMIDLASAYYERAESNSDRQIDYGMATEYLGRALKKMPDDPIALFNRAIAEERLHLYEPAVADWEHYLRIDPAGPWADEARRNLARVRKLVADKRSSLTRPTLTPERLAAFKDESQLTKEINDRIEDYQILAVTEWLPQAFPLTRRGPGAHDSTNALRVLAKVAWDEHGDSWLTELLEQPHGRSFAFAVDRLAGASKANETGDYARGRAAAHAARREFRSAGNPAGEMKAQAEELYSYHLLYEGHNCVNLERNLSQRLQSFSYRWLQTQVRLEAANCAYLVGNLGTSRTELRQAMTGALDSAYQGLYLRGLGFQAESTGDVGDPKTGFALASRGLDVFWSTQLDVMKGYNFYTDLDTAADGLQWPNLQVAIWQQATSLIDLHPDVVQRAMAHRWYGNSAYLANRPDLAGREFATASKLFSEAPATEATARGRMDAEIWLAGLEVRRGDFINAGARLEQVRDQLILAPSFATEIGFYTTQAELNLRRNDSADTEASIQSAIYLAEWALRSFSSGTDRRQWAIQSDRAYRTLVWRKLCQDQPRVGLELWEWYRGSEYRSPTNKLRDRLALDSAIPPDARHAPAILTPTVVSTESAAIHDKSVIVYVVFPEKVAVWLYDDRGIFFRWIETSPTDLEVLATRFRRLCSTRDSDLSTLRSVGRSLYNVLIGPLEAQIEPRRTLEFELDGALSSIPMEALVDRNGHYLIESLSMVVSPGFYQTLHLHPDLTISRESRALIVSVPAVEGQRFAPLSDADNEASEVASRFSSHQWIRGDSATLEAIRHALRGAVVFHFAGHAVASPEMSGLILAQVDTQTLLPVLLRGSSIETDILQHLRLAVLSACETWPSADPGALGTEDLTQSLLRSGVPYVVASRWNVDSTKTAVLMRQFYVQLESGTSVPASLRIAQLKVGSELVSSHPYYWAAFGVQGL